MEQMREALEQAGIEKPEDRREAMERAFEDLSTETEEAPVKPTKEAKEAPVVKPEKTVEPIEKEKPLKPLAKPVKEPPGKKQPVVKADGEAKPEVESKGPRAPVSWTPQEREAWNAVSPEAKAAILRRETEIVRGLNESAAARRFGGEFYNIIRPFEHLIRASGVTPLQAVDNLVKTAGGLQTGTEIQKAQIVANICAAYGINLQVLDQVLAGRQPTPETKTSDNFSKTLDERLRPVNDFINEVRGARAQSDQLLNEETTQEAESFASDPKNEFFEDLRQDIADILDLAANRGRVMKLEEAYNLAAAQHPEISKLVKERQEAAEVTEKAKNFERSRKASISQSPGTPGGIGRSSKPGGGESRRDAIGRAWEDLSAG